MKAEDGRLAAMIEDILLRKQGDGPTCTRRMVEAAPVHRIHCQAAANDATYRVRFGVQAVWSYLAQWLSVFFLVCVKSCAKSAEKALHFAKSVTANKRQRAALAACFVSFFCLFPSDTHSANL